MSTELTVLTLAALLQVVQFGLYSVTAQAQVGSKKALGPRDIPVELTGVAGRLKRAMNNHFEGLILFSIAVFIIETSNQSTTLTQVCAHTYLIARIFYVPAYAQGLVPWRSVIWAIGFFATTFMLLAALF